MQIVYEANRISTCKFKKNGFSDVRASFLEDFPKFIEKIPHENNGIQGRLLIHDMGSGNEKAYDPRCYSKRAASKLTLLSFYGRDDFKIKKTFHHPI